MIAARAAGAAGLDDLKAVLTASFERLAEGLLGPPSIRKPREWRWGARGSVAAAMQGRKRGTWHSHEAGVGGGPYQLIQHARGCSFSEAVRWARDWTGGDVAHCRAPPVRADRDADEAADRARRIATAAALWRARRDLAGTVGEVYLRSRGIEASASGWPATVAFHPTSRSLIVGATTADGTVQAVQRVRLTPAAEKAPGTPDQPTKQTNGVSAGAVVRLPGDPAGPLLLAEGPETGLSVWVATGHETWISLGSVTKIEPPSGRRVVVCADDDRPGSPASVTLRGAMERWAVAGLEVAVASPWAERRGDKSDFNDVIQAGGAAAVRDRIAAAKRVQSPLGAPLAEVRAIMRAGVAGWLAGEGPQHLLLTGEPGSGKTHLAHELAIAEAARLKSAGEPHRILLLVPDHQLAAESMARITAQATAAGLQAAVLVGFGDLDKPVTTGSPCQNPAAVKLALSVGEPPTRAVCGPSHDGNRCAFHAGCSRLASVAAAKTADIVIAASAFAFENHLPAGVRAGVARAIVDEDLVGHSIAASAIGAETFSPLPLERAPVLADGEPDPEATAELHVLHARLTGAVTASPDGYLSAASLRDAGLTADNARCARALNWDRKRATDMYPGQPLEHRRESATAARINGQLPRIAAVWHAVEDVLTEGRAGAGRIRLELDTTRTGQARTLHIAGLKPLAPWLAELSILLLDGTGDVDRVRRLLPEAGALPVPTVAAAHVRLHLITGGFGATAMSSSPARQAELSAFISARVGHAERALLVTHKGARAAFADSGFDLAIGHHGAIAGRDGHRDIRHLFCTAGRSLPPEAAAAQAAALTGEAVPVVGRIRIAETIRLRDGSTTAVERMSYADPRVRAAHDALLHADIAQACGRARGVLRTASSPVDIYILGSTLPPGMVADTVQRWADVRPDAIDAMLQQGAVPCSPTHAAAIYPRLFGTAKAAEGRIARAVDRTRRQFGLPAGMTTADVVAWRVERQAAVWGQRWTSSAYQRAGRGHASATIHAPVSAIAMVRRVAAAALGPLTWLDAAREVVPEALKDSIRGPGTTSRPNLPVNPRIGPWMLIPLAPRAVGPPDG